MKKKCKHEWTHQGLYPTIPHLECRLCYETKPDVGYREALERMIRESGKREENRRKWTPCEHKWIQFDWESKYCVWCNRMEPRRHWLLRLKDKLLN